MRGKADVVLNRIDRIGITPAYAGKRLNCWKRLNSQWDHPRLCGEKSAEKMSAFTDLGSPPPMRGKGTGDTTIFQHCRITPAYAGKSHKPRSTTLQKRDHPRLCGEKLLLCEHCGKPIGSPPPMRGKVFFKSRRAFSGRITPAYAGKSTVAI